MKNIFVTAGCGFIGSHLVDRLLGEGCAVTVYDNCSTGNSENLKQHWTNPNLRLCLGDILDALKLEDAMKGCDTVWHLAGKSVVSMDRSRFDAEIQNNFIGTWNVLEAMRKLGIKEILFASTGAVYGEVGARPVDETYGPLMPISLYAASKLAAEGLISAYSHSFGINAWIFRFAPIVGPRLNRGVIRDFVMRLRKDPSGLEIRGDGTGQKQFLWVQDCIEGMLCAYLDRRDSGCEIYNLSANESISINRVAEIVIQETEAPAVWLGSTGQRQAFPGDTPVSILDSSKIKRLGWKPKWTSDWAVRLTAQATIEELK
jgi:UDP-glucose 4-epimerase